MSAHADPVAPRLLPILRYRDLAGAIDWLCNAFGFEKEVAVNDSDGTVFYAQVSCGGSMIMLGSVRDTDLDKLMKQPDEVGGIETQSCYLVVDDIDQHYARAKAAGAEIVLEIRSDGLGRRGYSCRDPQGHIWSFGTYNPWKGKLAGAPRDTTQTSRMTALKYGLALALVVTCIAAGTVTSYLNAPQGPDSRAAEADRQALTRERALRETAQNATEAVRRELSLERSAKEIAERSVASLRQEIASLKATSTGADASQLDALRQDLARERTAKEAAERAAATAQRELARVRAARSETSRPAAGALAQGEKAAREAAEAVKNLESELAEERTARAAAAREAAQVRSELAKERAAREALEREARTARERAALMEQQRSAQIETSATDTADPRRETTSARRSAISADDDDGDERISVRRPRKRVSYSQQSNAPAGQTRYPPTYVTGLSDVPWPYNIWYRNPR